MKLKDQSRRSSILMMNIMHWRLLLAVADEGNVTHAAEKVGISQSGASQAIAQVERMLGVALFNHDRKRFAVTANGQALLSHAREMLWHHSEIRRIAAGTLGHSGARVRLARSRSLAAAPAFQRLLSFPWRHPEVSVSILEGNDREVREWLNQDIVELGVVLDPLSRSAHELGVDSWVVLVPEGHRLADRGAAPEVPLSELVDEPFVLVARDGELSFERLLSAGRELLGNVRMTVSEWSSAFSLVQEGVGVSVVPELTLPSQLVGIKVLPLRPVMRRSYFLEYSKAGASSRAANVLAEEIISSAACP